MLIHLTPDVTPTETCDLVWAIEDAGGKARVVAGPAGTMICALGADEAIDRLGLLDAPGVARAAPISKPYKLVSAESRGGVPSVLDVAGREVGGTSFTLIAGPCTAESQEQMLTTAIAVANAGASMFRAGIYKPRTSPYAFQGLGEAGLDLLRHARDETGLPIVTEVVDVRDVEAVAGVADVIQIGARNMQNYNLLRDVGRAGVPVLLKRGLAATIEELLMAAEYVMAEGNDDVMLCERGIRTFEKSYRFTLDITAIPVLKELTHLPVIVDPSHAAGRRDWVLPLSLAAAAAGADGIIVETHPDPERALCDGPQAIPTGEFDAYARQVAGVAALAGKDLVDGPARVR